MKFNIAPLSKILLNKQTQDDPNTKCNFNNAGYYSGFISLDSKNRVLPLMPNDP
jgi:hypothetical protein